MRVVMSTALLARMWWLAPAICAVSAGCQTGGPTHIPTEPERREMLALMLPAEIKIHPFTKIASFDDDEVPDGILVVVRPLDRFGDPVKAVGLFYFELWSYQQASGERRGQPLAFWDLTLDSPEEVRAHWTRARMYEFQLAWTQGVEAIRPGQKYILAVTYRPPWDETIRDEYVLDFSLPAETMGQVRGK